MSEPVSSSVPKLCSEDGCTSEARVRGFCRPHYNKWWRSEQGKAAVRLYKPRAELKLPRDEITRAYLAGLIDGDGCITRRDPVRGYWRVTVDMTDVEIIDWLSSIGGARSEQLHKDRTRSMHGWYLSTQDHVYQFIKAIQPYLRVHAKQGKARAAIEEIESKGRNKDSNSLF